MDNISRSQSSLMKRGWKLILSLDTKSCLYFPIRRIIRIVQNYLSHRIILLHRFFINSSSSSLCFLMISFIENWPVHFAWLTCLQFVARQLSKLKIQKFFVNFLRINDTSIVDWIFCPSFSQELSLWLKGWTLVNFWFWFCSCPPWNRTVCS